MLVKDFLDWYNSSGNYTKDDFRQGMMRCRPDIASYSFNVITIDSTIKVCAINNDTEEQIHLTNGQVYGLRKLRIRLKRIDTVEQCLSMCHIHKINIKLNRIELCNVRSLIHDSTSLITVDALYNSLLKYGGKKLIVTSDNPTTKVDNQEIKMSNGYTFNIIN